jgi:hypothetical protein
VYEGECLCPPAAHVIVQAVKVREEHAVMTGTRGIRRRALGAVLEVDARLLEEAALTTVVSHVDDYAVRP